MRKNLLILLVAPLLLSCGNLSINDSANSNTSSTDSNTLNQEATGLTSFDIEGLSDEYWQEETSFSYLGYSYKANGIRQSKVRNLDEDGNDSYSYCIDIGPNGYISSDNFPVSFDNIEIQYVEGENSSEMVITSGSESDAVVIEGSKESSEIGSALIALDEKEWSISCNGEAPIFIYSLTLY